MSPALLELFLAPGSVALFPGFAVAPWLRVLTRRTQLYATAAQEAWNLAREFLPGLSEQAFNERYRMTRLADHADLFLSLTRSDRWLEHNLDVAGQWPAQGPFIATTPHWGNGFWSLRHLRAAGHRAAFLSAPIDEAALPLRLAGRYARLRNREVERASGSPVIYTGGSAERILAYLDARSVLVALLDLPPDPQRRSLPVRLLGHETQLPLGIFRLAAERGIPIVPFSLCLHPKTLRHTLRILPPLNSRDERELARGYAEFFDSTVGGDPAAWHFWSLARSFFPAPTQQTR